MTKHAGLALGIMMTATAASNAAGISYLALGDSYTIGESVAADQRWPVQLATQLRVRDLSLNDPQIIAATGWTTDELAAGMQRAELANCYDLVSLSIGVNNQFRQRELENFRQEYRQLLQRAIELAGEQKKRVFVLSIPDWSVTPFARRSGRDLTREATQLANYNQAKRELTEAAGVRYFDITPMTLDAATAPTLLATDELHPSGLLYTYWVKQIIDGVQALLATDSGC